MGISKADVRRIAALARIELEPEEEESIARDLDRIVEYVDQLREVSTESVRPTAHATEVRSRLRVDRAVNRPIVERLLGTAPARDGEHFRVPRILEDS